MKNSKRYYHKVSYSCQVLSKLELSQQMSKKYNQILSLMNTRPVELSYCMRTDIQTDMGKIKAAFLNFADAPDKRHSQLHYGYS
jgi:hypothetical protein